ncbi:MbtH family protein [Saccharothrix saharensis]|uniref:MbtH family protein n=1 Tax=Saccharothrix saharensis TaxID=571190 RepID=UPI0036770B07
MTDENTDHDEFLVVLNDEEQYSVWFADRDLPPGWRAEGTRGTREDCLAHIDRTWTDMRPRSVREHLAAHGG